MFDFLWPVIKYINLQEKKVYIHKILNTGFFWISWVHLYSSKSLYVDPNPLYGEQATHLAIACCQFVALALKQQNQPSRRGFMSKTKIEDTEIKLVYYQLLLIPMECEDSRKTSIRTERREHYISAHLHTQMVSQVVISDKNMSFCCTIEIFLLSPLSNTKLLTKTFPESNFLRPVRQSMRLVFPTPT